MGQKISVLVGLNCKMGVCFGPKYDCALYVSGLIFVWILEGNPRKFRNKTGIPKRPKASRKKIFKN